MLAMTAILVVSGSTRPTSLNQRLVNVAAERLVALGAKVTAVSLADYPLPFVDDDGRPNPPEAATALAQVVMAQQGLFISCPEYNSGYPPLLKNALDWVSMVRKDGPGLAGKVVGLGAASPGARGGYRALTQFRSVLELGFGALVIPEMASVPFANKVLPPEGGLQDEGASKFLDACLMRLVLECRRSAAVPG
jgi:chromate reductase